MDIAWNDKESVLHRVRNLGLDLKFASPILRNDPDLVLAAIQNDPSSFQYASERLRGDKDFIHHVITTMSKPLFLKFMDESLKDDYGFMLELVRHRGHAILWASHRLRLHWPLVLEALKRRDVCIHDIDEGLWLNPVHIQQALSLHPGWNIYLNVQK